MLRLRHAKDMERFLQVGEDIPEIVLINSHDGSSSYQLMAGLFRLVCANGMVVGNCSHDVRIKHSGNAVGEVIEGAYSIIENFGDMARDVDGMKLISLQPQEQKAFGKAALELKYPTTEDGKETSPITVEAVLEPRRYEDNKSDLWTTFSRIQENMIRGGVQGRASTGRRLTTRAVSGINQNVSLNRALWTLAKEMEALKTS
jgi:hypothetical protein